MEFLPNSRSPVLFLSHGAGPAFFLDYTGSRFQDLDINSSAATFFRQLPETLSRAKAKFEKILVISAHWEESLFTIDRRGDVDCKLFYDYSGFPKESYAPALTYPCKSDIDLAERASKLIADARLPCELKMRSEGFDHGVFIPLKAAFPSAQYPIVQISLRKDLDIDAHIRLGEVLAPLREEGVMIICSGQITHGRGDPTLKPGQLDLRSVHFMQWINDILTNNATSYKDKKANLVDVRQRAPHFDACHPRIEHFLPLLVAFGASISPTIEVSRSSDQITTRTNSTDKEVLPRLPKNSAAVRLFAGMAFGSMGLDNYLFHDSTE